MVRLLPGTRCRSWFLLSWLFRPRPDVSRDASPMLFFTFGSSRSKKNLLDIIGVCTVGVCRVPGSPLNTQTGWSWHATAPWFRGPPPQLEENGKFPESPNSPRTTGAGYDTSLHRVDGIHIPSQKRLEHERPPNVDCNTSSSLGGCLMAVHMIRPRELDSSTVQTYPGILATVGLMVLTEQPLFESRGHIPILVRLSNNSLETPINTVEGVLEKRDSRKRETEQPLFY